MSANPLPNKAIHRPASEQAAVTLTPGNTFQFPFPGPSAHPEIYLEEANKGDGPPLHSHPWPTWELVIEGEVRFQIDGEDFVVSAGGCIYTPPNAVHAYMVLSDTAKTVGINGAGALLYSLQSQAAPMFAQPGSPPMDKLSELANSVQVTLHGPPLRVQQP